MNLEQWVLLAFGGFADTKRCSGRLFASSFLDGRLVIETGASVTSHGMATDTCSSPEL